MATGVVKNLERKTSKKGSEYIRVELHDGTRVDFYSDNWKEELEENWDEYEGLIVEVYYEDRGYTFGKAIVPENSEMAGKLLDKKCDGLERPSDKMMRGWKQWVDLFLEA